MRKTLLIAVAAAGLAIPAIAQTQPPTSTPPTPDTMAPAPTPTPLPTPGATPGPTPTLDPMVDKNNNGVADDKETPKPHHTPRAM
jgi:hypothetical protein